MTLYEHKHLHILDKKKKARIIKVETKKPERKKREEHEKLKVRRPCVAYFRKQRDLNQLKRYSFIQCICQPDYGKKNDWEKNLMVLDGYEKGVFDMTLICGNENTVRAFIIEFKWGKNDYTDEQKAYADKAAGTPIVAMKIYSIDEFIAFVDKELK